MALIKQYDGYESHRRIVKELEIIRQYFNTEIRDAKRQIPALLNPDDSRLSEYVIQQSQVLTVYVVFKQLDAVPSPKP